MATQQTSSPSPHDSAFLKIIHWYKLFDSDTPPRLGMEVKKRLPYTTLSAFSVGMVIGASHGSKKAAYQFRAENAHRFPTTSTGWFQYHKTKNYTAIVGGVKEGLKMGFKLGGGAFAFCLFEETVDYARHDRRDFLSTVTAGLSFSGIYSLLARHDIYTAARTTKLGLKLSLAYGLMQDVLESLKGNRPAYVDFILGTSVFGLDYTVVTSWVGGIIATVWKLSRLTSAFGDQYKEVKRHTLLTLSTHNIPSETRTFGPYGRSQLKRCQDEDCSSVDELLHFLEVLVIPVNDLAVTGSKALLAGTRDHSTPSFDCDGVLNTAPQFRECPLLLEIPEQATEFPQI